MSRSDVNGGSARRGSVAAAVSVLGLSLGISTGAAAQIQPTSPTDNGYPIEHGDKADGVNGAQSTVAATSGQYKVATSSAQLKAPASMQYKAPTSSSQLKLESTQYKAPATSSQLKIESNQLKDAARH